MPVVYRVPVDDSDGVMGLYRGDDVPADVGVTPHYDAGSPFAEVETTAEVPAYEEDDAVEVVERVDPEESFPCHVMGCEESFDSQAALNGHLNAHSE